jgi:Protein of unknown function (DUF2750)
VNWVVNEKEFESLIRSDADTRYSYFVKRVADWQELWTLANEDGYALVADDTGRELVPVWPHARFAQACASDAWDGYSPRAIDLHAWIDQWLPGMERDGRRPAVFPVPGTKSVAVTPQRLRSDLEHELATLE